MEINKMTAKELAQRLNGREYDAIMTPDEQKEAQAAGLVVAYGQSDDLLEFDGAIYDEVSAYGGRTVYVRDGELCQSPCHHKDAVDCKLYRRHLAAAKPIKAVWHKKGNPCWTIETDIPHETFRVLEDGDLFGVGIVFNAADTTACETMFNNSLTLDELREMDGEPVWLKKLIDNNSIETGWVIVVCDWGCCRSGKGGFAFFQDYGKTWLSYRQKPETL